MIGFVDIPRILEENQVLAKYISVKFNVTNTGDIHTFSCSRTLTEKGKGKFNHLEQSKDFIPTEKLLLIMLEELNKENK